MKPGFLRALPILGLLLTPSLAAQDTTAYRVASMRVFLFHETTGTIDTIDLVVPRDRGELFNTNIGEGLAHGSPSGAVVVFVKLTGPFHVDETGHLSPPFAIDTTRSLRLNAQIDGRNSPRTRREIAFSVFGGAPDLGAVPFVRHGLWRTQAHRQHPP